MKVIVDTPIWSYALRTKDRAYQSEIDELAYLIQDQKVLIIGPIRQEILSGYSNLNRFNKLKEKLSHFENSPIYDSDYELAAEFCNECRIKGIQGSHTDFLICAVAIRLDVPIFTTDQDFSRYRKIINIVAYPRSRRHSKETFLY